MNYEQIAKRLEEKAKEEASDGTWDRTVYFVYYDGVRDGRLKAAAEVRAMGQEAP